MDVEKFVMEYIDRARKAQQIFEQCNQEQVDEAVRVVGKAVYDHGEELARMAVDETGMGKYEDKVMKNKGKAMAVWNFLKGKKSVGVLRYLDNGIVEVGKPIGVIGAVTPVTNPVMTPNHNAMIALKGRNAIIVCPHPSGKACGVKTVEYMRQYLKDAGYPEDLIQIIPEPTLEISNTVMKMTDVCISTGGPGMVKVAYSSGKPAFGVGPGNNQCLIDEDADIADLVPKAIRGRIYDNGVLCTCEQSIICPESKFDEIISEFVKQGAYYVSDPAEVDALRNKVFPEGQLNKGCVGLSAPVIADMAGIKVDPETKVLIAKAAGPGKADPLAKEKLFPVLTAYTYKTWEEGVDIVIQNLEYEGKGHSMVIHSFTKENIEYAAERVPVSRFLVNGIGSSGLGGAYTNGLAPTGTLGCGSWGNNSLSENLSYEHLINISRIAYTDNNAHIPTPEEVWGE
ncbi:MAG TPA: aldehyde dehydrogenase family protein [Clostridiales bacterium]|nr:aldehyde dehydrogenase family protein [Clostridiales bacterium]